MPSTTTKLSTMMARISSFLPTREASGWHAAVYYRKISRLGRLAMKAEAEPVAQFKLFMSLLTPPHEPPQAARSCDAPLMPPAWSMMSTPPPSKRA